jgi:CheY-like chemotaxis protein
VSRAKENNTTAPWIRYGVFTGSLSEFSRFRYCVFDTFGRGNLPKLQFYKSMLSSSVPAATPGVWRVLLVDDDPLVSDSIRRMLEFDQRHVHSVGSGAEALAVCEKENFDVVILDYQMPVMKGDALAGALKERYPGLPIIMITADAEKLGASAPLRDPVDLLIGKPFQLDELRQAIAKVVLKN